MRRIISLFLILAICGSLAACNKPATEYKTEIVGEWLAVSVNAAAVFNSDGTGELTMNGKHEATWSYLPNTDRYVVEADKTYSALVSQEYGMQILTIDGVDFYRNDDYDNALTLLISRRYEDIIEHTAEMTKLEANKVYDLNNGVTIAFTDIAVSKSDSGDGLEVKFQIINNRTDKVTDGLTLGLNFRYYLFDRNEVVTKSDSLVLAAFVDAESACEGTFPIPLDHQTDKSVERYGRVIGAVTFEMYGQNYYIDLSDYFR